MRGTVLAAAACVVAACTGIGSAVGASGKAATASAASSANATSNARPATTVSARTTASSTGANWAQYDANAARTGITDGVPAAGALTTAWTAHLDGAVYGQPLAAGPR